VVGDLGLRFEAQAVADGEVGFELVVVFGIEAGVKDSDGDGGFAGGLAEEAGTTAGGGDLGGGPSGLDALFGDLIRGQRGEGVLAVEIRGGVVGIAQGTEASAEVDGVFAVAGLDVVLQLVVVLGVVVEAEVAAAAGESALDDDGGPKVCGVWRLRSRMYWKRVSLRSLTP
jgi:hypothetical protein